MKPTLLLLIALFLIMGYFLIQKPIARNKNKQQQKEQATQAALQKAQKLMDAIYFYDDKFALAFKNYQFYFIDKNGDEVSKLGKWDRAEQFGWNGFAKVQRYNTKYLLDPLGNTYPVAYHLNDLKPNITALDLGGQQLTSLSDNISRHTQLKVLLLNNNQLTALPENISKLNNLEILSLAYNQLKTLPESITKLSNLQELELG
jgi:Leucine-rich repeat (LRR) protein